MKKIILHIGHGKTGSSAIQSFLALSSEELNMKGFDYPKSNSTQAAKNFKTTSGNVSSKDHFVFLINNYLKSESMKTFLLSSEWIFWWFEDLIQYLIKIGEQAQLQFIMFVRSPNELLHSNYNELVKRRRYKNTFKDYLTEDLHYQKVNKIISKLVSNNIKFSIINYSFYKNNNIQEFCRNINFIPSNDLLNKCNEKIINRSLTKAELELQYQFNRLMNNDENFDFGEQITDKLPEIPTEQPRFTQQESEHFLKTNGKYIEAINRFLPLEQKLEVICDVQETFNSEQTFEFNKDQIAFLAQYFFQILKKDS